jgi:hypothetical protein
MKPKQLFHKLKAPILGLTLLAFAGNSQAGTFVRGYFRQDGTYVSPHYRSDADGYRYNNWSSQGNVNPFTGRRGYENPYDEDNYFLQRPNDQYGYECQD